MAPKGSKHKQDEFSCQPLKDDIAKAIGQSKKIIGISNLPSEAKALALALNNLLKGTQKYMRDNRFQPKDTDCLPDSK